MNKDVTELFQPSKKRCPHCQQFHLNAMEEALCPLRPEQIALMIEQYGNRDMQARYAISSHVHYISAGQEYTGVILWTIASGETGTGVETQDAQTRYLIERDTMIDEYDLVYASAIHSGINRIGLS